MFLKKAIFRGGGESKVNLQRTYAKIDWREHIANGLCMLGR